MTQMEEWVVAERKGQQEMIRKARPEQQVGPLRRVSSSSEETEEAPKRRAQQL